MCFKHGHIIAASESRMRDFNRCWFNQFQQSYWLWSYTFGALVLAVMLAGCTGEPPQAPLVDLEHPHSRQSIEKIPVEKLGTLERIKLVLEPGSILKEQEYPPVRLENVPGKITVEAARNLAGVSCKLMHHYPDGKVLIRAVLLSFEQRGTDGRWYAYIRVDEEWRAAMERGANRGFFLEFKQQSSRVTFDVPVYLADKLLKSQP